MIDILQIEKVYVRHSLPHSIRSLSDTLDEMHVDNMVCKLEFEQLFDIERPFIAVAGKDQYPFILVERLDRVEQKIWFCTVSRDRIILTFDQFKALWNGVVLMAEKGENTKETGWLAYGIKQNLWGINKTTRYWVVVLGGILLIVGAMQTPEQADLRYLIKAIGLGVSLLVIFKSSLDPHILQRFCSHGTRSDCNEVFQSAGASLFGWASLGELSLAYFSASLFWGIFIAMNPASVFPLLDSLGMLFVVYSLLWQFYHKKWCSLCLLIDIVLIGDLVTEVTLWSKFQNMISIDFYPDIVSIGLLFVLFVLGFKSIVAMAVRNLDIPRLKFKHERLLQSAKTFWMLLREQPEESINSNDIPAVCNYIEAEHTITLVVNPSCSKCSQVHELLSSLENYRINLVFDVYDGDELSYQAALVIISSGMKYDWNVTTQVMKDWYSQRELPKFLEPNYIAEQDLKVQMDYCRKIHIEGTPTILIDNRRLPDIYDIEDLEMLL